MKRFSQDFPKEDKIAITKQKVQDIKEVYARGLYDTGQFYERTHHPQASALYYANAIKQFPDTKIADQCSRRLKALKQYTANIDEDNE